MLRRAKLKKLLLHKETIRELKTLRLSAIMGGEPRVSPQPCPPPDTNVIWTCTTEVSMDGC
jgi:hypothetical protein